MNIIFNNGDPFSRIFQDFNNGINIDGDGFVESNIQVLDEPEYEVLSENDLKEDSDEGVILLTE